MSQIQVAHTLRHMLCSKTVDHGRLPERLDQQWLLSLPAAVLHDQDELIRRFAGSQQLQDVAVIWQM